MVILCWVECNYWVIIYYLMLTSLSTQIIWVGMRLIMLKPPCYAWVNEVNLYDSDLFGIKCSVLCVNMIMHVNDFLWFTMFCNVFFCDASVIFDLLLVRPALSSVVAKLCYSGINNIVKFYLYSQNTTQLFVHTDTFMHTHPHSHIITKFYLR